MMSRLQALFFDQDGVIIDTERNGHRVAFNRAFREFGIDVEWDVETYHDLLQTGGGKERMRRYFTASGLFADMSPEEFENLIVSLHARKTTLLIEMLESGDLPLRPGVHRLMKEAADRGILLGICTTSNEKAAAAIAGQMLSDISFSFILAGDCVKRKKPDPEIYQLAVHKSGVSAERAIVIEDSHIGTLAARRAGLHVVATVTDYTKNEDMSNADLVLTSLGDDTEPAHIIRGCQNGVIRNRVNLNDLEACFFGR